MMEKPSALAESSPEAEASSAHTGAEEGVVTGDTSPHEESEQASEIADALRVVMDIARGHDPYTHDRSTTYRPEFHPDTIRSLCVVVSRLLKDRDLRTDTVTEAPLDSRHPLEDHLSAIEKTAILAALEETKWNRTEAARRLGITYRALRYKLKLLEIDR